MELQFHNKKFEDAVRDELRIYDRPLTEEDALLAYDLVNRKSFNSTIH